MASSSKEQELAIKIAGKVENSFKQSLGVTEDGLNKIASVAKKAAAVAAAAFAAVKVGDFISSAVDEYGYYVKEVGIYAQDPDEGEILYALAVGVANQWDYMPAYNDLLPSTITMDFLTEVANATDVTIVTPNSMYLYDQTKIGRASCRERVSSPV